jgi:raffinose synthase
MWAALLNSALWCSGTRKGKDGSNGLRLRIESGDEGVKASKWDHAVLVAAGHDAYELVDSAVAAAARLSGMWL